MDDSRFGAIVRAIRRKKRLTQSDVAAAAGVSQQTVSDVENGRLGSFAVVRDICRVLGVSFSVTPSWRGGDFDRLVDSGHAQLVEAVASALRARAWSIQPELTFNHDGDRGSVDVLATHPAFGALLIVGSRPRSRTSAIRFAAST